MFLRLIKQQVENNQIILWRFYAENERNPEEKKVKKVVHSMIFGICVQLYLKSAVSVSKRAAEHTSSLIHQKVILEIRD